VILAEHREQFSDKFCDWLPANLHIWDAFVGQVFAVIDRGMAHSSSKAIIHFLRHHTALHENGHWKLDNDVSPYLARLFDLRYPHLAGLWAFRQTPATKRVTGAKIL
jgi:hypothetical protein